MSPTLVLSLAVMLAAAKAKDASPLVGQWVAEKLVFGGCEVPGGAGLIGLRMTLDADGRATYQIPGKDPEVGKYKTDPTKDPPEIETIPPAGKGERTGPWLYQVDGDTLLMCGPIGDRAERPKKLESPAGSQVLLIAFKRIKQE